MITILASLVMLAGPAEKDLVALARQYNASCLAKPRCAELRGKYLTRKALRPIVREIKHQARRVNISPLFFMAWVQSESEVVSDAVSQYNGVKPHPTDPWNKPPKGHRTWRGLDFGLGQIHVPSRWAPKGTWQEIQRLRDPVQNIKILAEWVSLSRDGCRVRPFKKCRVMEQLTGVPVYRRPGRMGGLYSQGLRFLKIRNKVTKRRQPHSH